MTTSRAGPLRVGLACFIAGGGSGVPRYATALARALDVVSPEFPQVRLTLMTTSAGAQAVDARNLDVRDFRLRARGFNAGAVRVPLEQILVATQRVELMHFFDLSGPVLTPRRPFVTTIHDAGVAYGFRNVRHAYKRRLHPWAVRRAAAVVAVSQFTKDEAVRHLAAPREKISVIHSGPGLSSNSTGPQAAGTAVSDEPYVLYVGDLTLKKNLGLLVDAFDLADLPGRLLLVGRRGDGFGRLTAQIERSPKRDSIQIVEDADDRELDRLYRSATALTLPSRYEGFGFTPLEAMQRGCPVLVSDLPAVREVSGSGALLLPVDDAAAWASALTDIGRDTALREDLKVRGAKTVERYSWAKTARELCGLFLSLAPDH